MRSGGLGRPSSMTAIAPTPRFDARFSDPEAAPTPWTEAERVVAGAELFWITTVRADGRPHVTPLIAVLHEGALHFCTGPDEQKARNLAHDGAVALTTGTNTWAQGLDVVWEGWAERVVGLDRLRDLADAYLAKYGERWRFTPADEGFGHGDDVAHVFRVAPAKVLAFAKDPHGQTAFRFG